MGSLLKGLDIESNNSFSFEVMILSIFRGKKKLLCLCELLIRDSDDVSLRTRMKCKALKNGCVSSEIRKVHFVIFVVNGVTVLKSMDNDKDADGQYTKLILSAFNCPYVSFRGIGNLL